MVIDYRICYFNGVSLIGALYYLPVIFIVRHDTFWDWAECIVFIGLISLAGYFTLKQLFKKRVTISEIAQYNMATNKQAKAKNIHS